jgi:hypothetical protein
MSTAKQPSAFELFMAGYYGRGLRIAFGTGIVAAGLLVIGGTAGWAVAAFGLVPISAGVFGLCPVAPAWGGHFFGSRYCARK